jgi:dipeptide transport system substrate-binding protein
MKRFNLTVVLGLVVLFNSGARAEKALVVCTEGSPSALNGQLVLDGTSVNASRQIFDKLVTNKYGTTEVAPNLAESWMSSKDGLTYTFKLRKDVKFHTTPAFTPSRNFNADDVLFSFNRMRLKEHPYHAVGKGSYDYWNSVGMGDLVKDVAKVDDYTVKFTLNKPNASFVANLAIDYAVILSAEYGDQLLKKGTPEKIDQEPVGTGAFIFVRYDKDSTIRFKANPNYYGGKPPIDSLVYVITPDASVRYQKLKTGECQFIVNPAINDLAAIKADPKLKVLEEPGLNLSLLAMNVEKKPFDKLEVRQAINHAINRKAILDAIYLGHAKLAKTSLPPAEWAYTEKVVDYDYNPEKAKQLLKKAGFPNGFTTELWYMPVSRPYNPNGKKMGEMMQADLAKVGVTAKLITYDWPTYLAKMGAGEHEMAQYGWSGDSGDPDNFLNVLFSCSAIAAGGNRTRWCYHPYDDLVMKALVVNDQAKRSLLYQKAQVILKQQAPAVLLFHSTFYRAMSAKLNGYKLEPIALDLFTWTDLK